MTDKNIRLSNTQKKIDELIPIIESESIKVLKEKKAIMPTIYMVSPNEDIPFFVINLDEMPENYGIKKGLFKNLGKIACRECGSGFTGAIMVSEAWALSGKNKDVKDYTDGKKRVSESKNKIEVLVIMCKDFSGNYKIRFKEIKRENKKVSLVNGKLDGIKEWKNEKDDDTESTSLLNSLINSYKKEMLSSISDKFSYDKEKK